MSKKTFEEWISGFEERYTEEQLDMFKKVWNVSVQMKEVNDQYFKEENAWSMKWIHEVATKIGK